MKNLNANIIAALNNHNAHDLADALNNVGISAERYGYGDEAACDIAGYGILYWDDEDSCMTPGWVVRAFIDDCSYSIDSDELIEELDRIVGDVKRIL